MSRNMFIPVIPVLVPSLQERNRLAFYNPFRSLLIHLRLLALISLPTFHFRMVVIVSWFLSTASQRPDTSFPLMALQMLNLLHIFFFPQSFELMAFLIRLSMTVVPSLFLNSGLGYLNYLVLISPYLRVIIARPMVKPNVLIKSS